MLISGKMSSFNILSNKSYCRGKRKPRFLNKNVGTNLEAASLDKLRKISLVNVKADKLPKEMELNSLIIESSYIKNDEDQRFFEKVKITKMTVENSDIDSIDHLGLFQSDNNIDSLREKSNYILRCKYEIFPFPFPFSYF